MKISFTHKLLLVSFSWLLVCPMNAEPVASNELYATYQKHGDRFYEGGGEANLEATYHDWAVNYYIVSCGDSVLLRATTTETNNLENGWPTQLRVWTGAYNNGNEIQVNAGDNKNRYTSVCRTINASAADVNIHLFLNWSGNCTTEAFSFNRSSINNPIVDNVAPVIDPTEVTMEEVDTKLVFTFGDVTADDEYFYYVGDKDHNIGGISLGNKVYITKPTVQDGTTYKFRCYAVDYNGNKSAYKEFSLTMPFDGSLNLALNKMCSAGAVQNPNVAGRAVDGNTGTTWTSFGQGSEGDWWWKVDLGNVYDITEVKIDFQDCWNTYSIYSSVDELNWTAVVENEPSASNQTKDYTSLNFAGRYLKVVSSVSQIGIKEFEVYASGLAAVDATNPTVSASCTASTINSATLQIIATDEDDAGNAGTINSIKVSDITNGFAEQEVLGSLVGNEVTLNGLTYNTTYNFTITVSDLAGNTASTTVEVVLPFNDNLDIARGKSCTAGAVQNDNTPDRAVNGNENNFWTCFGQGESSDWWWRVDLGNAYNITEIKIHFNDVWGAYSIYHSLDGVDWIPVVENETANDNETKTYSPLAFAGRFLKVVSAVSQIGIKEFEVYASGFAPIAMNETDNSALLAAYDNAHVDVALSRAFVADGYWYTLCLPFDMSAAQLTTTFGAGYTLATLTGSEDRGALIHLNFDDATTIVAGKPYLFKPGTNVAAGTTIENVTIKNIAPSVDGDELMHFQGTFNATTLTGSNVRFVGDDDYLYSPADGGTNMGAFRCYFTIPSGSSAGMPGKRARIIFGEQTATGISDVQSDQVQSTKVLRDGQLFIIRDGRTYNAQGMLVK